MTALPGRGREPPPVLGRAALRLFLTVWLVYGLHAATNIVREHYLAVALAERGTVRVDPYLGLHPDLFEVPGRGAFINSSPGASFLGAVPYLLARPAMALLFRWRPDLAAPKEPTPYGEATPNRDRFLQEARTRGLDVRLGLAALSMQVGLMAPAGGLAAVLLFAFLARRLGDERMALRLAVLYAFGTPLFFRSGFLNQNALLAHVALGMFFVAAAALRNPDGPVETAGLAALGVLGGVGLLLDYSALPIVAVFGLWVLLSGGRRESGSRRLLRLRAFVLGVVVAASPLLLYQWTAFGHPLLPAQTLMPPTRYSGLGWHGLTLPDGELLWRNLFDPAYGLLVFCPLFLGAAAASWGLRRVPMLSRAELAALLGAALALYLFASCNQYGKLQWNTGVRYMVAAVPPLFLCAVPVLLRLPTWAQAALVVPSLAVSWATAMVRESVPASLARVASRGPELPWLVFLERTGGAYSPLAAGSAATVAILGAAGAVLWLLWRRAGRDAWHRRQNA